MSDVSIPWVDSDGTLRVLAVTRTVLSTGQGGQKFPAFLTEFAGPVAGVSTAQPGRGSQGSLQSTGSTSASVILQQALYREDILLSGGRQLLSPTGWNFQATLY